MVSFVFKRSQVSLVFFEIQNSNPKIILIINNKVRKNRKHDITELDKLRLHTMSTTDVSPSDSSVDKRLSFGVLFLENSPS